MKKFFRLFNPANKSPVGDLLHEQLRTAEISRAEHAAAKEYHSAMETMLDSRIYRLKDELSGKEKRQQRRAR